MAGSAFFAGTAVFVLCWAAYYWYLYSQQRRRLDVRVTELGADVETRIFRRKSALLQLGDLIDRTRWARERMQPRLEAADLRITPSEYLAAVIFLGVGTYLAAQLAFQTTWEVNLVAALAAVIFIPRSYLNSRRDHYLLTFDSQMPEVAVLMGNSLRAGLSVPQSFEVVAEKMEHPAGTEFARLSREVRLGVKVEEAMYRMLDKLPSDELHLMFTTIMIQRQAGGNLAHALTVMSEAMSARFKLKDEVRTMTAEARFTGWILVFLPVATLVLVNRMMPGSVARFIANPFGWVIVTLFIGIMVLAFVLIRAASNIRV